MFYLQTLFVSSDFFQGFFGNLHLQQIIENRHFFVTDVHTQYWQSKCSTIILHITAVSVERLLLCKLHFLIKKYEGTRFFRRSITFPQHVLPVIFQRSQKGPELRNYASKDF